MADRLMLLDTPTLYFRAYFGLPESITAPDGMPVNAVRGTVDFISALVTAYRPDRLIACFDADWRPAFRVAAIPSYKAHRVLEVAAEAPAGAGPSADANAKEGAERPVSASVEVVPDTLSPQVPVLEAVLDAFGIARGWADQFEADDAIAAYAAAHDGPVDVVTGDRDMYQLVDDEREVRVLNIARGVSKLEVVDDSTLITKYGIAGRGYADFATLRGDPSDGLPGVAGIGEKSAAALVAEFGSLEGILAALDDPGSALKAAARKRLDAARAYLAVAPQVVRVRADAPTVPVDSRLPSSAADPDGLEALAERFGLGSPVKRLRKTLAGAP
ncbi:MAG TPA: 5'-3' exonuclease H3TH domain-containing protein [Actinocrinis sp.]|nr:5'-3' exonuclease H3TH domain-containing protein [Actinocrinis sp.]HZP50205.1 5'-3' exonuclease H3TH domain-containing protein [Actinocrinis sp.]